MKNELPTARDICEHLERTSPGSIVDKSLWEKAIGQGWRPAKRDGKTIIGHAWGDSGITWRRR